LISPPPSRIGWQDHERGDQGCCRASDARHRPAVGDQRVDDRATEVPRAEHEPTLAALLLGGHSLLSVIPRDAPTGLSSSVQRPGPFVKDRVICLEDVRNLRGDVERDLEFGGHPTSRAGRRRRLAGSPRDCGILAAFPDLEV
jgi:hypothetical protein